MKKTILHELRDVPDERFREFASRKESRIIEGHVMADHVHTPVAIPPKYSACHRSWDASKAGMQSGLRRIISDGNAISSGQHFRACGYYASMVGRDGKVIAEYIRTQKKRDIDEDWQLGLGF